MAYFSDRLARVPSAKAWLNRGTFVAAAVIVLGLGTGCASKHTPGVWVGATFAELQRAFGDPEAVMFNAKNNRVYVFRESPMDVTETKLTYGDGEIVMEDASCAILFELAEKTVTHWDWYGEGCEAVDVPLPYQFKDQPLEG